LSGPLWPAQTADFLMRQDWPTIAGNHERQLLTDPVERMGESDRFARAQLNDTQLAWLAAQPPTLRLRDDIFLVHGTPACDTDHLLDTVEPGGIRDATDAEVASRLGDVPAALTLCGHSHLPRLRHLRDGRAVANPGSVGLPAYTARHPYPYRIENGDPRARYALVDGGQVHLCAVAYDHAAAARKAAREGRDDWARPLATGMN
jgi:predicted phosphodiesterase